MASWCVFSKHNAVSGSQTRFPTVKPIINRRCAVGQTDFVHQLRVDVVCGQRRDQIRPRDRQVAALVVLVLRAVSLGG